MELAYCRWEKKPFFFSSLKLFGHYVKFFLVSLPKLMRKHLLRISAFGDRVRVRRPVARSVGGLEINQSIPGNGADVDFHEEASSDLCLPCNNGQPEGSQCCLEGERETKEKEAALNPLPRSPVVVLLYFLGTYCDR